MAERLGISPQECGGLLRSIVQGGVRAGVGGTVEQGTSEPHAAQGAEDVSERHPFACCAGSRVQRAAELHELNDQRLHTEPGEGPSRIGRAQEDRPTDVLENATRRGHG
jgi:hypothetical protein